MMSTMTTPEVECRCDLARKQAAADLDASLYGKTAPRLWHDKRCPVAMLVELHRIERHIATLEDAATFDEPVIKALQSEVLAGYHKEAARLRKSLDRSPSPPAKPAQRAQPKGA